MVGAVGRLILVLSLFLSSVGVRAAELPAGSVAERAQRWQQLHQGFVRQYIDECLARRDQPGWSLEDEADLAMGYWWLLAEDYGNPTVQDQLFAAVKRGISHCRRDLGQQGCPPEHRALLGNLIIMAGQVQVARGNYLSAARYAREGKKMLETVRQSNPEIVDTYFSLGLYLYYVDLSSPLVRGLQRILFFPPGDSRQGIRYLEKTALESGRFGPMARVALATIYSNGENRHGHALSHLRTLRRQYPENPLFLSLTAEVLSKLGDFDRARELLDKADRGAEQGEPPYLPSNRDVLRVIRAELDLRDFSLDTSHQILSTVVANQGGGPEWVGPVAAYSLARLLLLAGDEQGFEDLLRSPELKKEGGRYRRRMKRLPGKLAWQGYGPDLHQVFRYWITGDVDQARLRLLRLRDLKGNTGLISYLLGELYLQQGDAERAGERFREYLVQGRSIQAWAAGWSLIRLGDLELRGGNLEAARHRYRQAESSDEFPDRPVAVHRLEVLARMEARRQQRDSTQSR